jgi:tRNA/rRNA methyltransferase
MNLGQAVAICLYELVREGAKTAPNIEPARASAVELERITQLLIEALGESGYVAPQGEAAALEKTRRMLRRMNVEQEDAVVLLGMVRQILWKLKVSR